MLAAIIIAALHFAEARELARIAENAHPSWLAAAIALQVATYVAVGQVFHRVARAGDCVLELATACRLSLAKLFVDQAVPSAGLGGTVVLASGLRQAGLPRSVVAACIVVEVVTYYAAFVVCLALALVVTAISRDTSHIITVVSVVFFVFAIALIVVVLALSWGRAEAISRYATRIRLLRTAIDFIEQADPRLARSPRLFLEAMFYQLALVACDAATLWVLIRALGEHGSASGVFASFMLSSVVRTIGVVPGSVGVFEAASVVTLRMVGVPTTVALAATLLFRGLSFWLPMIPGLWFSRRVMVRRPNEVQEEGAGDAVG